MFHFEFVLRNAAGPTKRIIKKGPDFMDYCALLHVFSLLMTGTWRCLLSWSRMELLSTCSWQTQRLKSRMKTVSKTNSNIILNLKREYGFTHESQLSLWQHFCNVTYYPDDNLLCEMFFFWCFIEPEDGPSIDGLSTSPKASIGESVSLIQPLRGKTQTFLCSAVTPPQCHLQLPCSGLTFVLIQRIHTVPSLTL